MTDPTPAPTVRPVAVLMGAPGAGKSTVGRRLAHRLGVELHDIDQVIERRVGKPVAEIFADEGEPAFRAIEEQVTAEVLGHGGVVSLGGGAVLSARTREALVGHRVIWLKVSVSQAARRVGLNEARPLLLGNVRGRLIRLLEERTPLYAGAATEVYETDELSADAVVEQILAHQPTSATGE